MPSHSTWDHISALQLIKEQSREYCKDCPLFIAFIDFKAVFNMVDHQLLCSFPRNTWAPDKISTSSQICDRTECCVWVNGKESNWFSVRSGVTQGCVAASDLFNCVINHLMLWICQPISTVQLGSYYLMDLEYVDNTTLFSNTATDLIAGLNVFKEEASELGLVISWEKSKHDGDSPDSLPITTASVVAEFISSFNYPRSIIKNTCVLHKEINWHWSLAVGMIECLWEPL